MDFDWIEEKHQKLLIKAMDIMKSISDKEHDIIHMNNVLVNTKDILSRIDVSVDREVSIIAAYWHDVGRSVTNKGHEKVSAQMLRDEMTRLNYEEDFIEACYKAIINHRWDMEPLTIEGKVLKDADKLDFLGIERYERCLNGNQKLDAIMEVLPILRNEVLYFSCSKELYDQKIVELLTYFYKKVFK